MDRLPGVLGAALLLALCSQPPTSAQAPIDALRSLDGWRGYQSESVPTGWRLADGVLSFDPERGGRGDLITRKQYSDFELELEWCVSPGGNSGIFFRVSEGAPATYNTGPEMQVLDNSRHVDGKNPLTSAGANYALHAPVRDVTQRVGEYNRVRLRVVGPQVQHWLNGLLVVEYELWTPEWKSLVEGSKFRAMPGYGLNRKGHLALQDHGDRVWFRNVRITDLAEVAGQGSALETDDPPAPLPAGSCAE